jgi:D-glycero-alpha-D-manno-heptose-7-phosphate kinase
MERLAREASDIEIGRLGKPIGIQDQYIAAYGNLRFFEFCADGQVTVEKMDLDPELHRELSHRFLLFFTGINRRADAVLAEQKSNIRDRMSVLREIKQMAYQAKSDLQNGDLDSFGSLLHRSWELKKRMAGQISNGTIDDIYNAARKAGAVGGKITGAGGGGFILLYAPHEKHHAIRKALSELQELPFQFEADGSKVIFNYRR